MPAWLKKSIADKAKLDEVSWDAYGVWEATQWHCAGQGVATIERRKVPVACVRRISEKRIDAALAELVAEGLLKVVAAGVYEHTIWNQPENDVWDDPVKRERWQRAKALSRDNELTRRIKARDRNCCRYCGIRVRWGSQTARDGGTYDHVDPDGDNSMGNVVVACRACNGHKKDRTPEQAGMGLLPVPAEPGSAGVEPPLSLRPRNLVRARETGPSRAGAEPGLSVVSSRGGQEPLNPVASGGA
jgi:5-methylcytosine-specific restriction endonuclease McrA